MPHFPHPFLDPTARTVTLFWTMFGPRSRCGDHDVRMRTRDPLNVLSNYYRFRVVLALLRGPDVHTSCSKALLIKV